MSTTTETPDPSTPEVRQPSVPAQVKFSFGTDAVAKKEFYEALTEFIKNFGGSISKKAQLDADDTVENAERWRNKSKFADFEFRLNKKFRVSSLFIPVESIKIRSSKDTLQFKGRNAGAPNLLVFSVLPPADENLTPWTVEVDEELVRRWLGYGMIY